jgi:putative endonuclease
MLPTVYILTNRPHGTLYIGVTGNPEARITQHRTGKGSAFARKYNLHRLVYVEHFITMACAIRHEKQMKAWRRGMRPVCPTLRRFSGCRC